jgi:phosphomethylpyrimidine synthase
MTSPRIAPAGHPREHGGTQVEIADGMAQKSKEFAASGNRVYLPLAD